jgi:hypothetical protein
MDGGGLAHQGAQTITAWRREGDVFLDKAGQPEQKIGEGKDVTLAVSGNKVYSAWIEHDQLVLWTAGRTETIPGPAAYPNLTALAGGGALLAWEQNGGISVRRLP